MTAVFQKVRFAARMGFVIMAWVLVALVFVQVFHAGSAVLVNPGDWSSHTNIGHMFALPIMAMLALSIIGWMPLRFSLLSLGLFALYLLQGTGFLAAHQREIVRPGGSRRSCSHLRPGAHVLDGRQQQPVRSGQGRRIAEQRWQLVTFLKSLKQ